MKKIIKDHLCLLVAENDWSMARRKRPSEEGVFNLVQFRLIDSADYNCLGLGSDDASSLVFMSLRGSVDARSLVETNLISISGIVLDLDRSLKRIL